MTDLGSVGVEADIASIIFPVSFNSVINGASPALAIESNIAAILFDVTVGNYPYYLDVKEGQLAEPILTAPPWEGTLPIIVYVGGGISIY